MGGAAGEFGGVRWGGGRREGWEQGGESSLDGERVAVAWSMGAAAMTWATVKRVVGNLVADVVVDVVADVVCQPRSLKGEGRRVSLAG